MTPTATTRTVVLGLLCLPLAASAQSVGLGSANRPAADSLVAAGAVDSVLVEARTLLRALVRTAPDRPPPPEPGPDGVVAAAAAEAHARAQAAWEAELGAIGERMARLARTAPGAAIRDGARLRAGEGGSAADSALAAGRALAEGLEDGLEAVAASLPSLREGRPGPTARALRGLLTPLERSCGSGRSDAPRTPCSALVGEARRAMEVVRRTGGRPA